MKKRRRGNIKWMENTRKNEKRQKIVLNDEQMGTTIGYIVGRMVMSLDEWLYRWMNGYVTG
jgi:hypothetical protein